MHGIKCPACGGTAHYRLKDNRLQCAGCRKKFTARKHRSKLPEETLRLIAQNFWRMVPAAAAAAEQGINSKTLQKYYDLLRRAIAEVYERDALERFGATAADPELFHGIAAGRGLGTAVKPLYCLAQSAARVALLPATEKPEGGFAAIAAPEILGWVYAKDHNALSSLDLDRIHSLPAVEAKGGAVAAAFWIHAKRGLVKYHGGFRKNFYHFMREMEFRFNNHDEDVTRAFLTRILQGDINT